MPKGLVIDNSLSGRKVVERARQARSIEVASAASGTEAPERLEHERPDIVVCDVILPDREGYEICQFVRECPGLEQTPVLLISGIVNSTVLARAAEVQSSDVMFKPFTADELASKIGDLLSSHGMALGNGSAQRAEAPPPTAPVAPAPVAFTAAKPASTASGTPPRPVAPRPAPSAPASTPAASQPAALSRPAAARPPSPPPPSPAAPEPPPSKLEDLGVRLGGFIEIPG